MAPDLIGRLAIRLGMGLSILFIVALTAGFNLASSAASGWTHPARHPATRWPTDRGFAYEDLHVETKDGLKLAAWYVPSQNHAAIVMLHGISGNRAGVLDLASVLAEKGYGVIIPDLRAHGDSEGSVTTFGLNEVRDVRAALGYLKSPGSCGSSHFPSSWLRLFSLAIDSSQRDAKALCMLSEKPLRGACPRSGFIRI